MSKSEPMRLVERLDKYAGLAAVIASASLLAVENPAYFFALVGVAVALLGTFLLRVLLTRTSPETEETEGKAKAQSRWAYTSRQRSAAVAGLVALVLAAGASVYFKLPKPLPVVGLEIADLDIVESDSRTQWEEAVSEILAAHAADVDLPEDDVRAAYRAADPAIVRLVSDALESEPPEIELVRLQLTLGNKRTESPTLVTDVIVWVYSATLLFSCQEEGYLGVKDHYDVSLCPEVSADELPARYDVPAVSFNLAAGTGQEVLDVLVSNDPSCTFFPGVALYELELELIYQYDGETCSLVSDRFVVRVPTPSYGIGAATIMLEAGTSFEPEDECQAFNLNRALAMDALWKEILHSPKAEDLRRNVRRIEAERDAVTSES